LFVIDDPWTLESNGHTSATTVPSDPWQNSTVPTSQVNPWGGNNQTIYTNDTSLSVNLSDPWGLGATNSRQPPPLPSSPPVTTNTIDNELSDFFGAGASKIFRLFIFVFLQYHFLS
jgi:hypothetical protein